MNTQLILPAAFALTAHAFLFFGLPGENPIPPDPVPAAPLPREAGIQIDEDPPPPDSGDDLESAPVGAIAPRRGEAFVPIPEYAPFVTPARPAVAGDPRVKTIPVGWARPGRPERDPGSDPLRVADLDHPPRARVQPAPDYPAALRARREEGTVLVEFCVDEHGNVYAPTVLRATGAGFAEAALRAVARWKFESGTRLGRRVRFRISVPLVFRIDAG